MMSPRRLHPCCPYLRKAPGHYPRRESRFRPVGCLVDRGRYSLSTSSVLRRSYFRGSTLYPVALGHMCNQLYSSRLHTVTDRSEEHTSELQSLAYLVCRLLLEKKNINNTIT